MTTIEPDDERFGPDAPYDDLYDDDGELAEPVSLEETLERLKRATD